MGGAKRRRQEGQLSQEAVRAFVERAKADQAFRDKVMAVEDQEERLASIRADTFHCPVEQLDWGYLHTWAAALGVQDALERIGES